MSPARPIPGNLNGRPGRRLPAVILALCLARGVADIATDHDTLRMAEWTVHIDRRLLTGMGPETRHALAGISNQLEYLVQVVPETARLRLQQVPLWLSPEYPGVQPRAEYHPNPGWLRENDRNPAMARAIEFTNVRIFDRETRRMPALVLHELAHAYHHRVLGFDEPLIRTAYEKARVGGTYDAVERLDAEGRRHTNRAYAMTNAKEYFAETTEAFFATNDFFPFTRDQLKHHDPEMFRLLEKLWGCGGGTAHDRQPVQ